MPQLNENHSAVDQVPTTVEEAGPNLDIVAGSQKTDAAAAAAAGKPETGYKLRNYNEAVVGIETRLAEKAELLALESVVDHLAFDATDEILG